MIALGADHGGYKLKEEIKRYFDENDIQYIEKDNHLWIKSYEYDTDISKIVSDAIKLYNLLIVFLRDV